MHFLAGEEALNLDGITTVAKGNGRGNCGRFPVGHPEGGMSQLYIYGKCVPACTLQIRCNGLHKMRADVNYNCILL